MQFLTRADQTHRKAARYRRFISILSFRRFAVGGWPGLLSGAGFRAQRDEEFFVRQGVDDVASFEPAAPRGLHAVFHDLKLRGGMCVGGDDDFDSALLGQAKMRVAQIESVGISVAFHNDAVRAARVENCFPCRNHKDRAEEQDVPWDARGFACTDFRWRRECARSSRRVRDSYTNGWRRQRDRVARGLRRSSRASHLSKYPPRCWRTGECRRRIFPRRGFS